MRELILSWAPASYPASTFPPSGLGSTHRFDVVRELAAYVLQTGIMIRTVDLAAHFAPVGDDHQPIPWFFSETAMFLGYPALLLIH